MYRMAAPEMGAAAPAMTTHVQEAEYFADGAEEEALAPFPQKSKMDGDMSADDSGGATSPAAEEPEGAHFPSSDDKFASARRPLLIYQADLGLGVFRVEENLDKIEAMALSVGGYLVARTQQRITVRVPASDFERTVDEAIKLGDVHRREVTAQDVTAEYLDIQIRLKNALAMRERLEELLQKAQDVKEALKVEEQLGRVAEQIEVMKGRLKYLREVTSFSTISVEVAERSAPLDSRVELPFEWLRELGLNSLLSL
jgi:hypothetical protein